MTRSWRSSTVAMVLLVLLGATMVRADPFDVPDGGPEEQAKFIQGLMKQRPHDAESQTKMREAALKAAERILAAKPNDEQLMLAVQVKAGAADDPQELTAFEAKLKKTGHKAAARFVHVRLLVLQLQHSDNKAAFLQHLDELKKMLGSGPLQPGDEGAAEAAAQIAERMGDDQLAGETYESMAKLLAATPQFAGMARQMQATARRMKLVGNTMRLEGKTLDGKDLVWDKYRGKVVLIDFWATWCGPCMQEIINIKANYEKYQKQGFDVIGISLDQMSSQQLAEFVKKENVAWTICRDADLPEGMANYYGIQGIPQLILVGRDGKVISLNCRGPALGELVEKALGAAGGAAPVADEKTKLKKEKEKEAHKAEEEAAAKKKRELAAEALAQAKARPPREWTDASGQFHITAKFRGMASKVVRLELADGSVISIPLEKLSDDDQERIRSRKY